MSRLYKYRIPGSATHFIGNNELQVIQTLMHYHGKGMDIKFPRVEEYERLENIVISCSMPWPVLEQFFRVQLTDQVALDVNANIAIEIQMQFLNQDNLRRGSLYKFEPNPDFIGHGLIYLPRDVMIAGREYNWERHDRKTGKWLKQREESLQHMEEQKHTQREGYVVH